MSDLDPIIYQIGETITISRRLSEMTGVVNVDPSNVYQLIGRLSNSSDVVFTQTMTPDVESDTIACDVGSSEISLVGAYKLWIRINSGSGYQDVKEFDLVANMHAVGNGAEVGQIFLAARGLSPVAWRALRGFSSYGDDQLQYSIDLAKLRVLKAPLATSAEVALDPRVVDYIAKRCLVDSVLPAVIDFWTDQIVAQSAHGNSAEVKTFPDRIAAVQKQIDRFSAALDAQYDEVVAIIGPIGTPLAAPLVVDPGAIVMPTLDDVVRQMHHRPGVMDDPYWLS